MQKDINNINKKKEISLLWGIEQKFINFLLPYIPKFINGYNLTIFGLIWIFGILIFSYFAQQNIKWLWVVSLIIVLQWVTDSFDGAIGRYRNSGLVRWGYYMDHLLDYLFMTSVMLGYGLIVPNESIIWICVIIVLVSIIMINSFLSFSAISKFRISNFGIGPTEGRMVFIIINILTICYGLHFLENLLLYIIVILIIYIIFSVYKIQKESYNIDMHIHN